MKSLKLTIQTIREMKAFHSNLCRAYINNDKYSDIYASQKLMGILGRCKL